MTSKSSEEKALIVFDYIYHAMRAKHVLDKAGFKIREVAPPPEYRTGCDLAIEINAEDIDAAESLLEKERVLILDILLVPKDSKLSPVFLTQLIKTFDIDGFKMVRCGNVKVTYEKASGMVVNISGGG